VLRRLLEEWPLIKALRATEFLRDEYGYDGSVDLVKDADRVVLEGHVRALEWLGGVPRECVYDNLRAVVARRERDEVVWNRRFLHLRGHYGFHATACTPATPGEKGAVEAAVRYLKSGFWPARRFADLYELDQRYDEWRDVICNRRTHASGRFPVDERLAEEQQALRPLPPARFDWSAQRSTRVPVDGYVRHGRCFYRAPGRLVHERVELRFDRGQVWIVRRGQEVARYARSYEQGVWLPPPIRRAEPPAVRPPVVVPRLAVAPPELADYAELLRVTKAKVGERLPYLLAQLKAPRVLERLEPDGDAGARPVVAVRALPRDAARGGGLRPRRIRPACGSGTPPSPR
jgi:hypothetical protein